MKDLWNKGTKIEKESEREKYIDKEDKTKVERMSFLVQDPVQKY